MKQPGFFKGVFITFLCQLLLVNCLYAQVPNWVNYSKDFMIQDIDFEGNYVWLSTYGGGLVRFDKTTGTSTFFNGANSGLVHNVVNNVLVASNGDKWISTDMGGLQRYNNYSWTNYYTLPSNDVICHAFEVDEDTAGNIWISSYHDPMVGTTWARQLFKFDGSGFTEYIVPGVPYIKDLKCDLSGNVWLAVDDGLMRYNGTNWTFFDSNNSNIPGVPSAIQIDSNNNLCSVIYAASGFYLSKYNGSTFQNYLSTINIGSPTGIDVDAFNNILIYGGSGIASFDGTTFTSLPGMPMQGISHASRDSSGLVYTAFFTGNDTCFYVHDPVAGNWNGYFTSTAPLSSNYGRGIAIDKQNNRWISTSGNEITRFDGLSWIQYNSSNSGIPNAEATCVFTDQNDKLWIGFSGSNTPIATFDGSIWQYFSLPGLFSSGNGTVHDITEDQNGTIWVATSQGLARYYLGVWYYYNNTNLPIPGPGNTFTDVDTDMQNNLWANATQVGLLRYDGTNWTLFDNTNSGLVSNNVGDFTFDSNNNMWITGSGNIVQKFDDVSWTTYPSAVNQLTYGMAFGITYNSIDNTIWLGSPWELVKYDFNTWQRFSTFNSGICSGIYEIDVDQHNNKWLVTSNSGIVVFNENGVGYETIYNTQDTQMKGKVFFDNNGDGLFDAPNDHGVSARKVRLLPDSSFTYTTSTGNFIFSRDSGQYEVEYLPDSNWVVTSDSLSYHVPLDSTSIDSLDFGTLFNGMENDAEIVCAALSDRCNVIGAHVITYRNKGTTILDGEIIYVKDPLLTYSFASPPPFSISGDTLKWEYLNLLQFEERQIVVNLMNPPAQPGGAVLSSYGLINQNFTTIDCDSTFQSIICSSDPNDKQVHPIGVGVNHEILQGESLTYTVRFQNTGNDSAFFVMVVDTLSSYLDINTFEFLSSSHDVQINCAINGIVSFTFNNINLVWSDYNEPESHGFVKFRIQPKNNLSLPVTITNSALIFFDFNPYILTNTVSNNLVSSYTGIPLTNENSNGFMVYPNPSDGHFTLQFPANNSGGTCRIYNSTGKLVREHTIQSGQYEVKTDVNSSGLYLISYYSNSGSILHQKIISR